MRRPLATAALLGSAVVTACATSAEEPVPSDPVIETSEPGAATPEDESGPPVSEDSGEPTTEPTEPSQDGDRDGAEPLEGEAILVVGMGGVACLPSDGVEDPQRLLELTGDLTGTVVDIATE